MIKEKWESDAKIDKTEAGTESLNIPKLHSRYYNLLIEAKKQYKDKSATFSKLYRYKHEYYLGLLSKEDLDRLNWAPFVMRILRSDLSIYMDADDDLCRASRAVEDSKYIVDMIEDILKNLNQRNFQISNYINWNKFMNGIV